MAVRVCVKSEKLWEDGYRHCIGYWIQVPAVLFKTRLCCTSTKSCCIAGWQLLLWSLCHTNTLPVFLHAELYKSWCFLQGKMKHLTVQCLLPSVQPGPAKGGLTCESCLAHAFWPGSSKALKHALQNSRLSTCLTVLLDQGHGGRRGKLLLLYFNCDWQFGL